MNSKKHRSHFLDAMKHPFPGVLFSHPDVVKKITDYVVCFAILLKMYFFSC